MPNATVITCSDTKHEVVAFYTISIKPRAKATSRGVGGKREPWKRKKKTRPERERVCEKPADTERSGCVCTR